MLGGTLAEDVKLLGRGGMHMVFGIGKITNPKNEGELYLAVRLNHRIPYETGQFSLPLEEQLGAYEYAFEHGPNPPPYFVGAITSSLNLKPTVSGKVAGILTEDISCGGRFKTSAPTDENYVERWGEGESEKIFVDPNFGCPSEGGRKYIQKRARIDIL